MTVEVAQELAVPRLRGVFHLWAFYASIAVGAVLVSAAPAGRGTLAAAVYAASIAALFGVSALYHRVQWSSPARRLWMRRLDHTMIFVSIAGSYTPYTLLVLDGPLATAILVTVWGSAVGGAAMKLLWIDAPNWVVTVTYLVLAWWGAVVAFPSLVEVLDPTTIALMIGGGVVSTAGALIFALQRPDPIPDVFGFHELFHVLSVAGVGLQYAAVAFFVVPGA
jgi:hemolysin III